MRIEELKWVDHPKNPLIQAPGREFIIADPTFLPPDKTPDGKWHLFAHSLLGIHHYVSNDGIEWAKRGPRLFGGMRPFLFIEGNVYVMFYERFHNPWNSEVAARTSSDLERWSDPIVLVVSTRRWQGAIARNCSNPCLVKAGDEYRLYFSAGIVWLPDCGFPEPRHIGLARSKNILGPYEKLPLPLISPVQSDWRRNMGAGAIKVIANPYGSGWIGFHNGIYRDAQGRSRSSISLLSSEDGIDWKYLSDKPIIEPTEGWKRAFVYALDVRRCGDHWRLYYNARSGWFRGRECIGLAQAQV